MPATDHEGQAALEAAALRFTRDAAAVGAPTDALRQRRNQLRAHQAAGLELQASAARYDLSAVLDGRAVPVCGIGDLLPHTTRPDATRALTEQLLAAATTSGAAVVLLCAREQPSLSLIHI